MSIDIAAIAARGSSGVVGLRGHRRRGTGTVVADGIVVTTAHNARSGHLEVSFADGSTTRGTVAARYDDVDLAVVLADTSAATPLTRGDTDAVRVGTEVVAIGAPDGIARATLGAVATRAARFRTASGGPVVDAIEHTAPLPRGASGGPVLDGDGGLVGLNVNRAGEGFYQAVPTDTAFDELVAQLARGEVPEPRRLGVTISDARRAAHLREAVGLDPLDGALVDAVEADGPAAAAGVSRGDLLVGIDGSPISGPDDLLLGLRRAGETAVLSIVRGAGEPRQATVTFG